MEKRHGKQHLWIVTETVTKSVTQAESRKYVMESVMEFYTFYGVQQAWMRFIYLSTDKQTSNRLSNKCEWVSWWLTCKAPFTRYNLLSIRMSNQFDNRLNEEWPFVQHGCQIGCTTELTTVLNEQPLFVQQPVVSCIQPVAKLVVQPGLTTGWTNSGCSFNTVVKSVYNRFDNRVQPISSYTTTSFSPVSGVK